MSLLDEIRTRIRNDGPLPISDYMSLCLLHPEHGYYTNREAFGADGDFTTAPEISQMFGELLGLALAQSWLDQGAPAPFVLAELGPGRGTLMADLLRATRAVPGFHDAMQLWLVEASPKLRATQKQALKDFTPAWCDHVHELPDAPVFFVANEFFDALPVRQFIRTGPSWSERLVGLSAAGALQFGLGTASPQAALTHRLEDTDEGDLVEICAPATAITETLAQRLAAHGGAGLIIDYGDWRSLGDTLQALRAHAPVAPLETPGAADLTTHVDFEALAEACRAGGAAHSKVTPQGVFLERLGITDRARSLAAPLSGAQLDQLIAAHRRLTHPDEMGNLFKVIGLFAPDHPCPAGLLP